MREISGGVNLVYKAFAILQSLTSKDVMAFIQSIMTTIEKNSLY